ncbi:MAG: phospholipase D-like domain-containing protein [Candidatus Ratteibacteria bacterium]
MRKFILFIFLIKCLFCQIDIYFTPNKKTYSKFINLLKNAEKSIYISSFSVNPDFLSFLENKKIDIKIVCEYGGFKNGKVKIFEKNGLFHAKFIIIDGQIAIITSANLTVEHFFKNHNNFVIINDREIAKYLMRKFDSFWNNYIYAEKFNSENIKIFFSPENDCELFIKNEIERANSSINFASYTFTNREIAEKLISKRNEGVEVKGIIETYNIKPYSVFYLLLSYNCNVRKSNISGFLHDKFFIFDKERIITGSFNPTKKAKENIEILLFIKDKKIAEKFYNEWRSLYLFKSLSD